MQAISLSHQVHACTHSLSRARRFPLSAQLRPANPFLQRLELYANTPSPPSLQIAAVVAESTAFLGIPAVGAGAAAARSGPVRGLRAAQSALPGQTQVPQCLRQAAEKGSLSLSTLYQAVNTLEKSGSVSVAQVDSLLQRVQGKTA